MISVDYWVCWDQLLDVAKRDSQICLASKNELLLLRVHICSCKRNLEAHWPWKLIRRAKARPRIACFGWIAALAAKNLCMDTLQRRGMTICSRCFFAERSAETSNLLLLHCDQTWQIWALFLGVFGVYWMLSKDVKSLIQRWHGHIVDCMQKQIWRTAHCASYGLYG